MLEHTILFLAANPLGTDRLALDREARAIQLELQRTAKRDRFDFVTRWAVEPLDLLRELRTLKPTIVHFSGHGGAPAGGAPAEGAPDQQAPRRDVVAPLCSHAADRGRGLFFQGPDGRPQFVSADAIAATFGAAGSSVRLVVFSACYSAVQAATLVDHVDCVVGMDGSIGDDAARCFAVGFYGGLGDCESVEVAFRQGNAAIRLNGLSDHDRPRLQVRGGVDASQLVLAADPSQRRRDQPAAVISASHGSVAAASITGSVVIAGEPLAPEGDDG